MLQNTFVDSINKDVGIKVKVCDNIDSDSLISLLENIKLKKTMFCVITKSGTTSETLAQMMLVMKRMEKCKIDIAKHFTVITTRDNDLWKYAWNRNIKC